MEIAVVILNWNGKALLEQFLPSVVQNSAEANIYVADNASTDDSIDFLKTHYPKMGIIRNKINGGFAKGYNDALQELSEDIFILLNSDVEVTPGWLKPIITEFQTNPETAAIQPKILDFRKRDYFEYAGAAGGFIDKFGYPYCRGRILNHLEEDHGQYNDHARIFWASGACLAIRKDDFYRAGKFDEDYFAHQEEIDLCWRLFNLGKDVKFAGNSTVYHLGGGTLNNLQPKKTFFNFRNSLYSLLKNVPGKRIYFLIFSRLILDGIAGIKFILERKPKHALAIIQAHFSFYKNFRRMLNKRLQLSKKGKYYEKTSVLYSYYILQKKKYSEL
ncbi:MAG TPA: glycosyltransferase family 2 protein [Salinimicrobium sp.]|nr:glycosyltransferase family 2 protein [Salinimicrobium sp.]